ncbi:MAG: hypothetical protein RL291_2054 [Pseudomonadota bacterium]
MHHQALSDAAGKTVIRRALVHGTVDARALEGLCGEVLGHHSKWVQAADIYAIAWTGDFSGGLGGAALEAVHRAAWTLEICPKPAVALMDGAMGPGCVVPALFGTHRAGTVGFSATFDGAKRGELPPPGVAWFLARRLSRGAALGMLLGGVTLGAGAARALGLLTHVVPAGRFGDVLAALEDAEPIDPLLDGMEIAAPGDGFGPAEVERFARGELDASARALDADLRATIAALVDRAAKVDLDQALLNDWRVGQRWHRGERPVGGNVDALFRPLEAGDLVLPPRPRNVIAAA